MLTALGKKPGLSANCSVCREFRETRDVATTLFEQDRPAQAREFLRLQGWPSLRGRGGYRSKALDAFIGDRRPPGLPSAFSDAWPVAMDVENAFELLRHLPEGLRREEHLDANGLGALWDLIGGGPVTIKTARGVVAHFYGVSERTLDRKLTREGAEP